MERSSITPASARRNQKNKYRRLIEAGRDELSERQMEVLFTLYEQPTMELAAAELDVTVDELEQEIAGITSWREGTERQTKEGKTYKKRLSRAAFVGILADHPELSDDEQAMIRALIDAPNQVVAAQSVGMSYGDFQKQFIKIRRTHDF